jgi:predicted transcriptional regulator
VVMGKAKEFDFEKPAPGIDDEDEATLAAIDDGIRDAKAGRTVEIKQARKLLPKWITTSSSPKER